MALGWGRVALTSRSGREAVSLREVIDAVIGANRGARAIRKERHVAAQRGIL